MLLCSGVSECLLGRPTCLLLEGSHHAFILPYSEYRASMQEAGLIKVECFDAKSGQALGSFKVRLHEGGRIYVPELEKAFNATGLLLGAPDGELTGTIGDGFSYYTFSPGSAVEMYRWQSEEFVGSAPVFEFSWPNFLRFHQHAQGKLASCFSCMCLSHKAIGACCCCCRERKKDNWKM